MESLSCDVLVIGCGAAGLRAAIAAAEKGAGVCAVARVNLGLGTSTVLSRGHFAGARDGWSAEEHRKYTLQAGRGINRPDLVDALVSEAPARLEEIVAWGLPAEIRNGHLYTIGTPPVWGKEIARCLWVKAGALGVKFRSGLIAARILMEDGGAGVLSYSREKGEWLAITSRTLILATGGGGALYMRHDNPQSMLGGGYALALEAGAVLEDMEFVQFLPLAIAEPRQPQIGIPSTVARKGVLINRDGEEILEKYAIKERPADQLARDRLSQALFTEIYRNGKEVFLDLRGISGEEWEKEALTASVQEILRRRYGADKNPLRVAPTAHYCMGGVRIDPDGRTGVPGLFAAGEIMGGLHGANRMGGNALTDALVFGARAGEAAAAWAKEGFSAREEKIRKRIGSLIPKDVKKTRKEEALELTRRLREILWNFGGVLRNKKGLLHAVGKVEEIREESFRLSLNSDPRQVQEILDLRLASQASLLIVEAALRREESRGSHFREDFPDQNDDLWRGHLQVALSAGKQEWSFEPMDG